MLNRAAEFFSGGQTLPQLLQSEFNQGFALGVALAVVIILAMLILKILFWMMFRTRRCREIALETAGGNVQISHRAIDAAVQADLSDLKGLSVENLRIFRKGKRFSMQIKCTFSAASGSNFPETAQVIRERTQKLLQETFGIHSINRIDIRLETLTALPPKDQKSADRETLPTA